MGLMNENSPQFRSGRRRLGAAVVAFLLAIGTTLVASPAAAQSSCENNLNPGVCQIVGSSGSGWQSLWTGLTFQGYEIESTKSNNAWPLSYARATNGFLYEIGAPSGSWTVAATGLNMGLTSSYTAAWRTGSHAEIFRNVDGDLQHTWWNGSGWSTASTGVALQWETRIDAVYISGSWPVIMAVQGGVLHRIYGTGSGWQMQSTGISMNPTQFEAVNRNGQLQVMSAEGGTLYQTVFSGSTWSKASTGITGVYDVSATYVSGSWPQVITTTGAGDVYRQISGTSSGWISQNLPITSRGYYDAVYMGGNWPQIMEVGYQTNSGRIAG